MITIMNGLCIILCLIFFGANSSCGEPSEVPAYHAGMSDLKIYHMIDVDQNEYVLRGKTFRLKEEFDSLRLVQDPYTFDDYVRLELLAYRNDFYRTKYVITKSDGKILELFTYSLAEELIRSNLTEHLTIWHDLRGDPIAISSSLARRLKEYEEDPMIEQRHLNTYVELRYAIKGPVPECSRYLRYMASDKQEKEKASKKENRSFFSKYWMYIVPVVLLMILSGSPGAENGRR